MHVNTHRREACRYSLKANDFVQINNAIDVKKRPSSIYELRVHFEEELPTICIPNRESRTLDPIPRATWHSEGHLCVLHWVRVRHRDRVRGRCPQLTLLVDATLATHHDRMHVGLHLSLIHISEPTRPY